MTTTTHAATRRLDPRRAATTVAAVLFAAATALASFGLPSAILAWTTEGSELPSRTHYVVWGALAGIYLPVAALALLRRSALAPAQQLVAFLVAALGCAAFAADAENLEYVGWFSVPVVLLLLLQSARRALVSWPRPDRPTLAVALVAAGPALAYAVANVRLSAATPFTDTLHGGYLQAAILAVALVLGTGVAAGGAQGWQITAGCVTVAAAMLGAAGVLFPQDPSSVGRPGGVAVLVAATTLGALSVRRHSAARSGAAT
jgi:hypothetical protein